MAQSRKVVLDSRGNETNLNDPDAAYIVDRSDRRLERFKTALREGTLNRPSPAGTIDLWEATGTEPPPDAPQRPDKRPAEDQEEATDNDALVAAGEAAKPTTKRR